MVKVYLSRKGVPFTEHNISKSVDSLKSLVSMGYRTTPVTVIGRRDGPWATARRSWTPPWRPLSQASGSLRARGPKSGRRQHPTAQSPQRLPGDQANSPVGQGQAHSAAPWCSGLNTLPCQGRDRRFESGRGRQPLWFPWSLRPDGLLPRGSSPTKWACVGT